MQWSKSLANLLAIVALLSSCAIAASQNLQANLVGNSTGDARTLLQEQVWAEAFNWSSTTHMCQWPAVSCDDTNTSVIALYASTHLCIAETITTLSIA